MPTGKGLYGPINRLIAIKPAKVFWDRCPEAEEALRDWRQLLKELVHGELDFTGTVDASVEGAGGV